MFFRIFNMLAHQILSQFSVARNDSIVNLPVRPQGLRRPLLVFHGDFAVKAGLSVQRQQRVVDHIPAAKAANRSMELIVGSLQTVNIILGVVKLLQVNQL